MAYNQEMGYDYAHSTHNMSGSNSPGVSQQNTKIGEEEIASDVDEPPDDRISFKRRNTAQNQSSTSHMPVMGDRRASLLTQGLLVSPSLTLLSDSEAPVLTSDGGMTSPTRTSTPSPPLPAHTHTGLANIFAKDGATGYCVEGPVATSLAHEEETPTKPQNAMPKASLGRRRCITFACGRQEVQQGRPDQVTKTEDSPDTSATKLADPPKRPCMLRFACPMKPSTETARNGAKAEIASERIANNPPSPQPTGSMSIPGSARRPHRDSESTIKNSSTTSVSRSPKASRSRKSSSKSKKLDGSEATRFHEFAGSFIAEDEWTKEQTAYQQKITVNDTLRKENAIRKLGQEAEEEALEDDVEEGAGSDENLDDLEYEEDLTSDHEASDGGNESDDEEGFADSDDESDVDSQYQFWTTSGLTTAATSTDHVERIRPMTHRLHSDSSIDSMAMKEDKEQIKGGSAKRADKGLRLRKAPKMRPGTPDLPDSTDFVCGTLDEDRPLEAAYMSCLEERKRSRHKVIPQDIDPSFPTSDPEDDDDDDDDDNFMPASDEPTWIMGRPDNSDGEHSSSQRKRLSRRSTKSPMPSPKRLRSPAPARRAAVHRSPPPRRLFGQSPHHSWGPALLQGKIKSPPSTRRTSICTSPGQKGKGFDLPHLAQRPHLTHTTSLPRTPNPFWGRHLESRNTEWNEHSARNPSKNGARDSHSRGPIDIVKGIEHRRQRRREKFWRQHYRTTGKERERRCQPGKGAERMRELGLEMAVRCKGYGLKAELILSA